MGPVPSRVATVAGATFAAERSLACSGEGIAQTPVPGRAQLRNADVDRPEAQAVAAHAAEPAGAGQGRHGVLRPRDHEGPARGLPEQRLVVAGPLDLRAH